MFWTEEHGGAESGCRVVTAYMMCFIRQAPCYPEGPTKGGAQATQARALRADALPLPVDGGNRLPLRVNTH